MSHKQDVLNEVIDYQLASKTYLQKHQLPSPSMNLQAYAASYLLCGTISPLPQIPLGYPASMRTAHRMIQTPLSLKKICRPIHVLLSILPLGIFLGVIQCHLFPQTPLPPARLLLSHHQTSLQHYGGHFPITP